MVVVVVVVGVGVRGGMAVMEVVGVKEAGLMEPGSGRPRVRGRLGMGPGLWLGWAACCPRWWCILLRGYNDDLHGDADNR